MQTPEVQPDITTNARFGYVTMGDGQRYRVARFSYGPRGVEIDTARAEWKAADNTAAQVAAVQKMFTVCLSPFYGVDRILSLFNGDMVGHDSLDELLLVLSNEDPDAPGYEKKKSQTETLTQ